MSWMGKIVGGAIGWVLMGPLGVILGAALGHAYDSIPDQRSRLRNLNSNEQTQMTFFVSVFSMLGKIAGPHGSISSNELQIIKQFIFNELHMGQQEAALALNILQKSAVSQERFEDFAQQFYGEFRGRPELIQMMLDILIRVSAADGRLSDHENRLLDEAVRIFQINTYYYERLKDKYFKSDDQFYAILNCTSQDSDETIKKNYRSLVKENHPDRIASQGLPVEFMEMATKKFQKIQEAYEQISKERGF